MAWGIFSEAKDPSIRVFWGGVVAPALLVLIVAANLITRAAIWPDRAQVFIVYRGPWEVGGIIGMKLGLALFHFAWLGLANWGRTERYASAAVIGGIAILIGGFVSFAVAVF